jgi:hypothetical protein
MAKANKGFKKQPEQVVETQVEAVVETQVETVVEAKAEPTRLRLPLPQAREHNKQHVLVTEGEVVAANVALTSKGTNPKKQRVYGYDNLSEGGGRVPKQAKIAVVPGAELPRGVKDTQWSKLQSYAGQTVEAAYGNGVSSRTVRRSYRAGAIRFVK